MPGQSKSDVRKLLFERYAANLQLVKETGRLITNPNISNVFICPLCLRGFTEKALSFPNSLSIEHVPPKLAGGKVSLATSTLTCKPCNNKAGATTDAQLKVKLQTDDVLDLVLGSSVDAQYSLGDTPLIAGTISIIGESHIQITGDPKRTNPKYIGQIAEYIDKNIDKVRGKISINTGKTRMAEIALLKIAYLIFFRTFGYGYIMHPAVETVRRQITDFEHDHIPRTWLLLTHYLPDLPTGISTLQINNDIACFLTTYEIKTPTRTRKITVILPKPEESSTDIFSKLESFGSRKTEISYRINYINLENDFLLDKDLCLFTSIPVSILHGAG